MSAVRQRMPRYENKKLLDLCHNRPCFLMYPGCIGENPDQPTVPAHPNGLADGKGVWLKTDDHLAIPGCPPCHWQHDYGTMLTQEQKRDAHEMGRKAWERYRWVNKLVRVA